MKLISAFVTTTLIAAFLSVNHSFAEDGESERSVPTGCNIGAYYYPWYGDDFHGHHYVRERLVPPQKPELGDYNDSDPNVISKHIQWSRYAGIDFWSASWWGPGGREDKTLREAVMSHPDLGDLKIAIHYETTGRTKNYTDYEQVEKDFLYLSKNYFNNSSYLLIEGKPVVFVYLTRVLAHKGDLDTAINKMRVGAGEGGFELYIVGDHAFGTPPYMAVDFHGLDAITNYDIYGSMGATGYAGKKAVANYAAQQAVWKKIAKKGRVDFFPSAAPEYNDTAVRGGHPPLSRKITEEASFGTLFKALLSKAKKLQSANHPSYIMINSWNEWHEDTQIEPVKIAQPTSKDNSDTGTSLTNGLDYEGYDTRYLDILNDFCSN